MRGSGIMNNLISIFDVLDNDMYKKVEEDFFNLLCYKMKKYTGGLISSIPYRSARMIHESNMYVVRLYLSELDNSSLRDVFLSRNILDIYNDGYNILNKLINKTKMFYYGSFLGSLVVNDNYFYNATLRDGIEGFFKVYNPCYDASCSCINFDYEALVGRSNLDGVSRVYEYLEWIYCENIICNKFNDVDGLLKRVYGDYKDSFINILEVVLGVVLVLEYLDRDIFDMDIAKINEGRLYTDYDIDKDRYMDGLYYAYDRVVCKLNLVSFVRKYMDRCRDVIVKRVFFLTSIRKVGKVFKGDLVSDIEYFNDGGISDYMFDKLINVLKNSAVDRGYVIVSRVKSVWDLVDVFDAVILNKEELYYIFSRLHVMEIMVMYKYYMGSDSYVFGYLDSYIYEMDDKMRRYIYNNYAKVVLKCDTI